MVLSLLLLTASAGASATAARTDAPTTAMDRDGIGYETHDPISISGDADLADSRSVGPLPPTGDDDGIRGGSGTADDPYVIARWRIPFDPSETPAIHVQGTTSHLVIRDIVFVPDEPTLGGLNVWIQYAENVTVRDLTLVGARGNDGSRLALSVLEPSHVRRVEVRNVTVVGNGTISFSHGREVVIEDVVFQGWEGYRHLSMAGGTYTVEDVVVRERPADPAGQSGDGVVSFGRDTDEPEGPCRATIQGLRVRGARGAGVEASGTGCRLSVSDADVTSNDRGVWVHDGASASITSSTFHRAGQLRWSDAGIALEDAVDTRIDDVTVGGYLRALVSEGSNFTIDRTSLGSVATSNPPWGRWDANIEGRCSRCEIRNSSITSIQNTGASSVDARWNWWGSADGPSDGIVEGDVLVEPWLTEPPEGVATVDRPGSALPFPGMTSLTALMLVGWILGRRSTKMR